MESSIKTITLPQEGTLTGESLLAPSLSPNASSPSYSGGGELNSEAYGPATGSSDSQPTTERTTHNGTIPQKNDDLATETDMHRGKGRGGARHLARDSDERFAYRLRSGVKEVRDRSPIESRRSVHISDASDSEEWEARSSQPIVPAETEPSEGFLGETLAGSLARKRPILTEAEGPVLPKIATTRRGGLNKRLPVSSHFLAAAKSRFAGLDIEAESAVDLDEELGPQPSYRDLELAHGSEEPQTQPKYQTRETLVAAALLNGSLESWILSERN